MDKIGIIGAMKEEIQLLRSEMKITDVRSVASYEFLVGTLRNHTIIVVQCGIGKVNAALTTQLLIDCFNVDVVINTGVAGAISDELEIGDIVISKDAIQHDMDATGFGYKKGQIPGMPVLKFKADYKLVDIARRASEVLDIETNVFVERIVSGDQFISSSDKKKELSEEFGGFCVEMEGAAIAQACYINKTPYVIIRAISDKADDSAPVNFKEFTQIAAHNTYKMIEKMLEIM